MNSKTKKQNAGGHLQRQPPHSLDIGSTHSETVIEGDKIITTRIVEILVEKEENPYEDIKKLMDAELSYNKQKLAILREHAANHPDAAEERNNVRFRRLQYRFLMLLSVVLVLGVALAPLHASITLGILAIIIISGILINGREREPDAGIIIKLVQEVLKRK